MEEKKKNKKLINKIFCRIFLTFLIAFSALYVSEATGYYEYELHKKVVLTNENIKQFEEDIKNGKNINIENYMQKEETNYSNKMSKAGLALSNGIGNVVESSLKATFDFLNKFMTG
ncbi:MAG: hypothetical protein PHN42_00990 [Bacilli bacterium]|nr:hypothetical protein [Bacilli bacterium]